ncbi:hypothetical protein DM01DRAFT_1269340, partial [Hesseltinella vesiculosa]
HMCHKCQKILSESSKLKAHYLKVHNIFLPSRPEGRRVRLDTDKYTYISQQNDAHHPSIEPHYACLSCLAHYPAMTDLSAHIEDTHL